MENRKELLSEILKRVQRNYVRVVEIERLTKELGTSLSRNDQESAQLLVKMRQDEIEQANETKHEIQMLLQSVNGEEQEKLRCWLSGGTRYEADIFEAGKIVELSGQLTQVLNRTIEFDKAINLKLAGKDSYYQMTT
ncbi:hypothetical protein AALA78_14610 [Lachnospiraceae bacterium 42-17]|jgi:hypothetical protein|nr:hypothetical protein [Dorea sp.]